MTELEILRRRRELALLSAQLQRVPLLRKLGHEALGLAVRAYRRRSSRARRFDLFKLH